MATTIRPDIGPMSQIDTPNSAAPFALSCPCCRQSVGSPSSEIIIDAIGANPLEAGILRAVMRADGRALPVERIYQTMYDDSHGDGPDDSKDLYRAFKVALCHLRKKLAPVGMGIGNLGYAQGYYFAWDVAAIPVKVRMSRPNGRPRKPRSDNGASNANAIFTNDLARSIRDRYAAGRVTIAVLAADYGCTVRTIAEIVRGKSYKDA